MELCRGEAGRWVWDGWDRQGWAAAPCKGGGRRKRGESKVLVQLLLGWVDGEWGWGKHEGKTSFHMATPEGPIWLSLPSVVQIPEHPCVKGEP